MPKLTKNPYYNSKGEKKLNNYQVAIKKIIVEEAGWTGDEEIKIYTENGKIIIEKIED